jgi:hypothetical protein
MTRSKYAVHFFNGGEGFVVRGTLDPGQAFALAVADEMFVERYGAALCGVAPHCECGTPGCETDPDAVADMADRCTRLIRTAKTGLYRTIPASEADREDEGITWWLRQVTQPGRGVWQGVEFYE